MTKPPSVFDRGKSPKRARSATVVSNLLEFFFLDDISLRIVSFQSINTTFGTAKLHELYIFFFLLINFRSCTSPNRRNGLLGYLVRLLSFCLLRASGLPILRAAHASKFKFGEMGRDMLTALLVVLLTLLLVA
jgi:hypothetical protein